MIKNIFLGMVFSALLVACGGGGGGGGGSSSGGGSSGGSFSGMAVINGIVTYTNYPVNEDGIDYDAEQQKIVRGAVIELQNSSGTVLASGNTGSDGSYSLSGDVSGSARIVVKAQLGTPDDVNTRVVDNTSSNGLYSIFTDVDIDGSTVTQNLNAGSGWGGNSYTGTRAAGPFSILDVIYQAQQLVISADNGVTFPMLTVNWSVNNNSSDGDTSNGDIGTSFYDDDQLFILGDENSDTDEYDKGVIGHEWGHYFEDNFSRSDSIGGAHSGGDLLHPSVSWSEGFGTALAAMILDDPLYVDTGGPGQSFGDVTDADADNDDDSETTTLGSAPRPLLDGYYSENTTMEVLYDVFDGGASDDDSVALGFTPIHQVLTNGLRDTDSFTSLFAFLHFIKIESPSNSAAINSVFSAENIDGDNTDEFEDPSDSTTTRLYTDVSVGPGITVDSNAELLQTFDDYGDVNKLLNQRFFKLTAVTAGCHTITVAPTAGANLDLTFIDGANVAITSSATNESAEVDLAVGEVSAFNVGAFSSNAFFSVSVASNATPCS